MHKPFLTTGQWMQADGRRERIVVRYRSGSQVRERQALELAARHHIPAPHVLGELEIPEGTYLIQSFVGEMDLEPLLPPSPLRPVLPGEQACSQVPFLGRAGLLTLLQELGTVCATMHRVALPGFGNWLESSIVDGVTFTLEKVHLLLDKSQKRTWFTPEERATVEVWVSQKITTLFSAEEPPRFLHADLHPANVRLGRVSASSWRIEGIIDFEHAKGWYPEYDLVVPRWHLVDDELWMAFLAGYGEIDAERLSTFEVVKLLMILSGWPLEYDYAQWAYQKLRSYFPSLNSLSISSSPCHS